MLARLLRRLVRRPIVAARELNLRAMALAQGGDRVGAEALLRRALQMDAGLAVTYGNLGKVLFLSARFDEALAVLQRGVEVDDRHAGLRNNLAAVLHRGGQLGPAITHYRAAIELDPSLDEPRANLLKVALDACDWNTSESLAGEILAAENKDHVDSWGRRITPICALQLPLDPAVHRKLAGYYAAQAARNTEPTQAPAPNIAGERRLRVGYLSCDFRNHAVTQQLLGVLRHHDRQHFEVFCYSYGPHDESTERHEVQSHCEHFIDISLLPDTAAAELIARARLDILLDLAGHTGDARPAICAQRPAPIQVNYLGYPGTSGADYIDYIIADDTVIPAADEAYYSERVLRMPGSFLPTDDAQVIDQPPSRESQKLPENAVVFCCFNQSGKIDRQIFEVWTKILSSVDQSVLWLRPGNLWAKDNLRRAASHMGLDPTRLVFAGKVPQRSAHLARYGCGDLFLDTHTYNAHATASDALWSGVPVLTWSGNTFASRVGASLLRALEIPELIVTTRDDYLRRAVELGKDHAQLDDLQRSVAQRRYTAPLFRSREYTRQFEELLQMLASVAAKK